jgi:hypothetical protein
MDSARGFEAGLYAGKKAWEIRIKMKWQSGLSEDFAATSSEESAQQKSRPWVELACGWVNFLAQGSNGPGLAGDKQWADFGADLLDF